MSFNATKKRAFDKTRHINQRRVAVRSCIQLCLYYSGLNGYQSIVNYYNVNNNLNSDSLNDDDIESILKDLTELRESSKQIDQNYADFRKEVKKSRNWQLTKMDIDYRAVIRNKINNLWDKFDTEENRRNKAALWAERRKQLEQSLRNSTKDRFHRPIRE